MSELDNNNLDSVLGRLVVEHGLATVEDLDECQRKLRENLGESDPKQHSLADLMVTDGIVTQRQINRLKPRIEEHKASQQIPGFDLIRALGAGAMARVYLAKQVSLDRLVAIKILPKRFTNNERFVERFYAEGKAAAKLNHPNIVGAVDVGRAGETHYFVMEYVQGKTVYDEITQQKRYSENEAVDIIVQIADALHHAHEAGLIHRDVKPKNIMITKDGVAKLADMGLARAVSDREAAEAEQGKAYGTPYYISPEQIRGVKDVDRRADIYSLGATFFHMVTGQVPFDGPNPSAVMHKHLKEPVVQPDHINPSLSAGVSEIIEVCMAKDRDKRYNSAKELLEDVRAVKRGEPPAQARKKYDLASLTALEETGVTHAVAQPTEEPRALSPILTSPVFVFAMAGWLLVLVLVVYLISHQ